MTYRYRKLGLGLTVAMVAAGLSALAFSPVSAYFSDSGSVDVQITAATVTTVPATTPKKVWVCKMVGPPDNPTLKKGKNPIHVSVNSLDAEEGFSDAHPSFVVDEGEDCVVPPIQEGLSGTTVPTETTVPPQTTVPTETTVATETP